MRSTVPMRNFDHKYTCTPFSIISGSIQYIIVDHKIQHYTFFPTTFFTHVNTLTSDQEHFINCSHLLNKLQYFSFPHLNLSIIAFLYIYLSLKLCHDYSLSSIVSLTFPSIFTLYIYMTFEKVKNSNILNKILYYIKR